MKKVTKKIVKPAHINLSVTPELRDAVAMAAKKMGLSQVEYIRRKIAKAAKFEGPVSPYPKTRKIAP